MIDIEEIEREIQKLEARGETTYNICERLAWLYVVRDHLNDKGGTKQTKQRSRSGFTGDSEFLEASSKIEFDELMRIMDEHMNAIKVIAPKEYQLIMRKIDDAKWRM